VGQDAAFEEGVEPVVDEARQFCPMLAWVRAMKLTASLAGIALLASGSGLSVQRVRTKVCCTSHSCRSVRRPQSSRTSA
jgi:hypothetical protein